MSDLINREALRREIYKDMAIEDNKRVVQLLQAIMDAPSVDAEPVRHGRWIPTEFEKSFGLLKGVKCSLCGEEKAGRIPNYCPNCGAKMDGGAEDEHKGT